MKTFTGMVKKKRDMSPVTFNGQFPLQWLLAILLLCSTTGFSQQTGVFEKNIKVNGSNVGVAFYVPENYSASNTYPVIIALHMGGSDGKTMRTMLLPAIKAINAIAACPAHNGSDNGTIAAVLNYLDTLYKTDSSKIVLTGYSMGGNPAFNYGFSNSNIISGIIGIAPVVFNFQTLNYNITRKLPVGIIVGSEDDFITETRDIKNRIENAAGKLKYIEKQGVTHMDTFFNSHDFCLDWVSCYDFVTGSTTSYDATDINAPEIKLVSNPVSHEAGFVYKNLPAQDYCIVIYNINGSKVYTEQIRPDNSGYFSLEISKFRPGVYISVIFGSNFRTSLKMVINHIDQ